MNEPNIQLVISFDPNPERREAYFHFYMCEFVPTLEMMGLCMCEAWHTAYGDHPLRLSCFLACDDRTVEQIVSSGEFIFLEKRLLTYVLNYHRCIVHRAYSFQY